MCIYVWRNVCDFLNLHTLYVILYVNISRSKCMNFQEIQLEES